MTLKLKSRNEVLREAPSGQRAVVEYAFHTNLKDPEDKFIEMCDFLLSELMDEIYVPYTHEFKRGYFHIQSHEDAINASFRCVYDKEIERIPITYKGIYGFVEFTQYIHEENQSFQIDLGKSCCPGLEDPEFEFPMFFKEVHLENDIFKINRKRRYSYGYCQIQRARA